MIYKSNLSVFKKEDDISFYLLGAYMTDGHIDCNNRHNSFKITSSDRDWLIKIGDLLCPSKPIYKKGINCFSFKILV